MSEVSLGSAKRRTRTETAAVALTAGSLFVFFFLTLLIDTQFLQRADESAVLAARVPGDPATPVGPKVTANRFVATVTGGYALNVLLKTIVARPRPDVVPFLTQIHSPSFPSGHAMMSTVVFLTLGLMLSEVATRRAVRVLVIASPVAIAVSVSLTRVYLGVHFPTDVMAGLCCGVAWTLGCWLFWRRRDSTAT
jgi:membrane-associated phospholipid phosphatase